MGDVHSVSLRSCSGGELATGAMIRQSSGGAEVAVQVVLWNVVCLAPAAVGGGRRRVQSSR